MAGFAQPLPPTTGYKTKVRVALLGTGDRTQPVANELEIAGSVAKGAETITLAAAATGSLIKAGQRLLFIDPATDITYPVTVSTNYAGSGTSLAIAAADEAIPDGAIAAFPTELFLPQSASTSRSTNVTEFSTFKHAGVADATPGQISSTGQFDGAFSSADAGGETLAYAQSNGLESYVEIEYEAPSAAYSKGRVIHGSFLVESLDEDVPLEGEVKRNFSGRFTSFNVDDPTPTA